MAVTFAMRLKLLCVSASMVAIAAFAGGAAAASVGSGPGAGRSVRVDPVPRPRHGHEVPSAGSPWQELTHQPSFNAGAMFLLTDGTVLVQNAGTNEGGTNKWWRLTPSSSGSYVKGTWSKVASMPSNYGPLYFASAVLPDGRFIVIGGEYNFNKEVFSNHGAIYDPVANKWTSVRPPSGSGWATIGDAPGTVLANGTFMVGASGVYGLTSEALLNAKTLTWRRTGSGKADGNPEQGWSLLPDGKVLTVDTEFHPRNTEIYTPSTGSWTGAGKLPVRLVDSKGEIGPQLLRPDGTVFAAGGTGTNAIYSSATGKWSAGPSFPLVGKKQLDAADAPSAVLPNGNVLVVASPGEYTPPSRVFDFNGKTLTQVTSPPNVRFYASNDVYMMVLPTGQVLYNDRTRDFEVYNPTGSPKSAWLPAITSVPATMSEGGTYTLSGSQLNGLTQAAAFGDDYQSATNYPLVRLTNNTTKAVVYARTFNMTSMTVAPGAKSSVRFTLPATIPTGGYTLVVVANGLASASVAVTVTAAG